MGIFWHLGFTTAVFFVSKELGLKCLGSVLCYFWISLSVLCHFTWHRKRKKESIWHWDQISSFQMLCLVPAICSAPHTLVQTQLVTNSHLRGKCWLLRLCCYFHFRRSWPSPQTHFQWSSYSWKSCHSSVTTDFFIFQIYICVFV